MADTRRLAAVAVVALALLGAGAWLLAADDRVATVTITDRNGTTLATVEAAVADSPHEHYRGLSGYDSLGPDEGMLFVFETAEERAFVMRDMAFPIDIVFIGADGSITAIHEAEPEDGPPWTKYRGRGKWVLEVRLGYTDAHGIEVGDRVAISYHDVD